VLHWNAKMETLFIGLDSGEVHILRVPKEHNFMRYEEVRHLTELS